MKKTLSLLTVLVLTLLTAQAQTFHGSRTDFRDETIYFLLPTRFYDGDPENNTQCWDNRDKNAGDPAWRGDNNSFHHFGHGILAFLIFSLF